MSNRESTIHNAITSIASCYHVARTESELLKLYDIVAVMPRPEVLFLTEEDVEKVAKIMGMECKVIQSWETGDEAYGFEVKGTKFFTMRWK